MTVTRWPHAIQRETCPYRLVPVPPPWGCVQSRSVSRRMWRGVSAWGTRRETVPIPGVGETSSAKSLDCGRVPSVCRRIVVLLVVALLGVAGPVTSAALAQSGGGAGDQQYEDPFGGSGSSGSGSAGSRPPGAGRGGGG